MPKIMVALATYNGERYLAELLESLAKQTRKPEKIFAVDDASKDATVQILESFKGLPMELIRQGQNRGVTANFSTAIEAALRECSDEDFIALADQDDVWLPEKLEILEREIGNADLVFGDAEVIDGEGKVIAASWRQFANLEADLSLKERILARCNVSGCMSLCRVPLVKKALPFPPEAFVHDEWLSLLATLGNGVKSLKAKVIRYRIHSGNTIGVGEHNLCMSEILRRSTQKAKAFRSEPRLKLGPEDQKFLDRWLLHLEKTTTGFLNPGEFPWVFKNRHVLFKKGSAFKTAERVLFSCAGLKFAKIFFGKS